VKTALTCEQTSAFNFMQLREMPTDADFDLTDPYSPPPRYNVLHDPHLKEYFQNKAMRRRLVEKGTLPVVSSFWSRFRGRRGGVMVSALDCGPSGPGSSPNQGQYSPVPLSTQT